MHTAVPEDRLLTSASYALRILYVHPRAKIMEQDAMRVENKSEDGRSPITRNKFQIGKEIISLRNINPLPCNVESRSFDLEKKKKTQIAILGNFFNARTTKGD